MGKPILTQDGSYTLHSAQFGENYHSVFGAVGESRHIFIEAAFRYQYALQPQRKRPIQVFEMGLGTGWNALLTQQEAENLEVEVAYQALEKYPLAQELWEAFTQAEGWDESQKDIHRCPWGEEVQLSPFFRFRKEPTDLLDFPFPEQTYDIIYFDAFSPQVQAELWTLEVFKSLYQSLQNDGILTTYCAKGEVRRNLQAAGFSVERLPGPPGKREILRARK